MDNQNRVHGLIITMRPAYIPGWDIKYCWNFGMGAMFIPQAWGWSRAHDAAWELSATVK